ncbi:hypothetical protein HELRODRAFT_193608 [Helobdella robusta]|uniref:HEPN domain-containing protein n=1 Tax=Helobdella robusta TaxID=6412 RepID=T1FV64_HELRO|nr:hypothetical protein HELRODRAFT_193608 [Helobdella robusta]ESN95266.1 hypothetical protein HELRODRAFT_193608 [Helobdella robusta]
MEGANMEEEVFNEGIILPPLLTQLKKILDQYPDDTQILKELVQNAEDAGAREVKFLYDRHVYATDSRQLAGPGMAKYQGPALYAYNSGLFDEDDWKGLRMLSQSVKQNDPFKVGYFGMGFKSVFHLTDLPSVLSGNKLAFIDPHQTLFDTSSHAWNLQKHPELLETMKHQIEPYLGIFNCNENTFQNGFYNGTLFRFPLRQMPSHLSKVPYSHDKMNALIDSFTSDAHLLPIFLKYLESVEIYDRDRMTKEPKLIFSISIPKFCLEDVRQKRLDFLKKTQLKNITEKAITATYKLAVETKDYINNSEGKVVISQYKYLVTQYHCCGQLSATFNKLHRDTDLNYLPWVGMAMPLLDPDKCDRDFYEMSPEDGRIFCFIPLTLEQGYTSGLPVHVNGFFALEQNRKHIKWLDAFSSRNYGEEFVDKRVLWNQCLLREALPRCYAHLILEAIKLNSSTAITNGTCNGHDVHEINFSITEEMIYRAFPSLDKIDRKWENLVYSVYSDLLKCPIVKTAADGGRWIEPRLAVFNTLDMKTDLTKILIKILLEGSVRVVNAPPHLLKVIKNSRLMNVIETSPSLVANACRSLQRSKNTSDMLSRLTSGQKLELLKYFALANKFDALDGLDLLPLADGSFHTFYYNPKKADRPIYIALDHEVLKIVPGADKELLAMNLDEEIQKALTKAASRGITQLKIIDVNVLGELIPRCFPAKLRSKIGLTSEAIQWMPEEPGFPNESWLELMWNFLVQHSPTDLSMVEKLPILPKKSFYSESGVKTIELIPLFDVKNLTVRIMKSFEGLNLGGSIEKIAEKIGLTIVDELPEYIENHSLVTRNYIFLPSYIGVLKAFCKIAENIGRYNLIDRIRYDTTEEEKRYLRMLFAKFSTYELQSVYHALLSDLPLFETVMVGSQIKFVSVNECRLAAPFEKIEFPLSSPLLDLSDINSQALGNLLGVRQLNYSELLEQVVFRDIENAFYEKEQVKEVMLHILKSFHRLSSNETASLKKVLKSLPFMESNDLYVPVSHYYDPEQELLKKLFRFEKRFPDTEYSVPNVLSVLREIGLRGVNSVEAEDIKEAAEMIDVWSKINSGAEVNSFLGNFQEKTTLEMLKDKSLAIIDFLHKNPSKLNEECGAEEQKLADLLTSIKWIFTLTEKPSFYPKCLPWHGSKTEQSNLFFKFEKPENMISKKYSLLAGSVLSVAESDLSMTLEKALSLDKEPDLNILVEHLKTVISSYTSHDKLSYVEMIKSIYTELSKYDSDLVKKELNKQNVPPQWIWNGDGFSPDTRVVFSAPFMDLRPFIHSLPVELSLHTEFLSKTANLKNNCDLVEVMKLIYLKHNSALESIQETSNTQYSSSEVRKDLHMCVSILNELKSSLQSCEDEEKKIAMLEEFKRNLYLPVHNEGSKVLKMALLSDCTFCDEEWLRQGYSSADFEMDNDSETNEVSLVHPNVPSSTSEALGVPTLMSRMLDAEELDISFGQSDSLTHRLNSLLLEYADGFAVPKELVQNADDAGATEISFLYDERENEDDRSCLLDEGMKECQGPALWVHNNAVFEDSDFENITKLNGATKLGQPEKIGKFGLGFNAVYNITDVPSFVSRHNVVIFDPHTYHLGKSIKDKRKPGIRIDLRRHKRNLKRFGNQFRPYNGIFNCNLNPGSQLESYNGTLFRFPLRTRLQASRSEISSKHYDDKEVKELLKLLITSCDTLLLFSQNICKISIYHLGKKCNVGTDIVEIFSMEKKLIKIIREMPLLNFKNEQNLSKKNYSNLQKNCQSLKVSAEIIRKLKNGSKLEDTNSLDSSLIIALDSHFSNSAHSEIFFDAKFSKPTNLSQKWLVCHYVGIGESLKMAIQDETLSSCVSAAAQIHGDDETGYVPIPVVTTNQKNLCHHGLIFTFMPLPLRSGLPVHINGAFAVTSNRKFLCQQNEDDKFDLRPVWNKLLMEDAVCSVYLRLLNDLVQLFKPENSYEFFLLWPNPTFTTSYTEFLMKAFYKEIVKNEQFSLVSDGEIWSSFKNSLFLDFSFSSLEIGKTAYKVFKELTKQKTQNQTVVAYFPNWIEKALEASEIFSTTFTNSYDIVKFFEKIFFPHILDVNSRDRDDLVLHALSCQDAQLNSLIANNNCIPVSPDGKVMKCINQLVDRHSFFAKMYIESDGRFPVSKSAYDNPDVLNLLVSIGMKHKIEHITWDDLLERAEAISILEADEKTIRNLVQALLASIGMLLELNESSTVFKKSLLMSYQEKFVNIAFLPLLKKPKNYPLHWKGEDFDSVTLFRPDDAYPPEYSDLICCVRPVIDISLFPTGSNGEKVQEFLLLTPFLCEPSVDDVIEQLVVITGHPIEDLSSKPKSYESVHNVCFKIYDFLQKKILQSTSNAKMSIIDKLRGKPFILIQEKFLTPEKISFNFQSLNCSPYLFSLPDQLKRNYYELMKAAGVKDHFQSSDYVKALQKMHENLGAEPLDKSNLKIALQIVNNLNDCMTEERSSLQDVVAVHGTIYIPDSSDRLKSASDLCYNEPECKWLPKNEALFYSHPLIPFTISKQLGVNTNRQEVLKKHSKGIPFGQREKLTNRIRRILSGYPCDKEILKEMLQNADDAGATEICFIKDNRYHGTERIFDKSWQPLQGPALCIYNNKGFSEEDLEAIQKLGEGSKRDDPNKTGQYGVGFNCVYHLTDAPSFLTKDPQVPETLCIFDPHARYVPDSTLQEPGRRFQNVQQLKPIFTDVFDCYLGDKFDLNNGTMFRLPLRNEEMVRTSEISEKVVTMDMIDSLFQKFSMELNDCMLFLNNIKSVTLCEVERVTGKLNTIVKVTSSLNEYDEKQKKNFAEKIKIGSQLIKSGRMSQMKNSTITYMVKLTDNKGLWESWLVTQSLGWQHSVEVSEKILEGFNRKELMLMPRGGVAAIVDGNDIKTSRKRSKKLYCFLPLPVKSEFQVNINGHFAVDYEARRNLWYDDQETSLKTEWNIFLFENVIADAYVSLLENLTTYVSVFYNCKQDFSQEDDFSYVSSVDLQSYVNLFPVFNDDTTAYWRRCATNVFRKIADEKVSVLPIFNRNNHAYINDNNEMVEDETYAIKWTTVLSNDHVKAVFDDLDVTFVDEHDGNKTSLKNQYRINEKSLKKHEILRHVLLNVNYPLLSLPMTLHKCFVESNIDVERINPKSVINYFHICAPHFTKCNLDKLPKPISKTPFVSNNELSIILQYCFIDNNYFFANLEGLPFLLTSDDYLRVFSSKNPVYYSDFSDLFPKLGDQFIDKSLTKMLQTFRNETRSSIFLNLDIASFSKFLYLSASDEKNVYESYVARDLTLDDGLFSKNWLNKVWNYLANEFENIDKKEKITSKLRPIEDWCLLPVCLKTTSDNNKNLPKNLLFSIKNSKVVLDYTKTSIISSAVKVCLRKLHVPEIDNDVFDAKNETVLSFVKNLISSLEDPSSVLIAITHALAFNRAELVLQDCLVLLKYFSDSIEIWREEFNSVNLLRKLPIHITTQGLITSLSDYKVYILQMEVPQFNLDSWKHNDQVIFLQCNPVFNEMYEVLDCKPITPTSLYLNFVLQNFHFIDTDNWLSHIQFLKDKILIDELNPDRNELIESLKSLEFITDGTIDSEFKKAADYYDPRNSVFKIMFHDSTEAFPPTPFNEYKWLDFMKLIGMQCSITPDLFYKFACEIEEEALSHQTEKTFEKSRTLISNLFSSTFIADVTFLETIKSIKFIPVARGKPIYRKIYPSHGIFTTAEGSHKFISFQEGIPEQHEALTWSSAFLLPDWANPYKIIGRDVSGVDSKLSEEASVLKKLVGSTLNVPEYPSIDSVIEHLQNLCNNNVLSMQSSDENREFKAYMRIDIFKKIYSYLQNVLLNDDTNSEEVNNKILQLADLPCIVSDMGQRFVRPRQIVMEIYEGDQIVPYLCKAPTELGEFKKLFLHLGATNTANEIQYATVLESLYYSTKNEKLHPNELRAVLKAVFGFFNTLFRHKNSSDNNLVQIQDLYLPSEDGYLYHSQELIYNDEPAWTERVKNLNCPFLIDLTECKLSVDNHVEMIKILPPHLSPKMLTSIVQENLSDQLCQTRSLHAVADKLRYQLNSKAFALGLARLIKHEHRKTGHRIKQSVFDSIQQQLKDVQVYGVDVVETYLSKEGLKIEESETETQCFVNKKIDSTTGSVVWELYINKLVKLEEELQVCVAEVVDKITGGLLKHSIHYIQPMLSCPPHAISKVLDRLKIRPDRKNNNDLFTSTLPVAGSFIPIEDHHLLKEDFEEFDIGEYVGYEIDDELTGEAIIVYAIIVEKVQPKLFSSSRRSTYRTSSSEVSSTSRKRYDSSRNLLSQKYLVNVGDDREPMEVSAADLYKFHRVDRYVSRSSGNSESNQSQKISRSRSPRFGPDSAAVFEPINDCLRPTPLTSTSNALVLVDSKSSQKERKKLIKTTKKKLFQDFDDVFSSPDINIETTNSADSDKNSSEDTSEGTQNHDIEDGDDTDNDLENQKEEEIRNDVSCLLEEAWHLPEGQRKKVIKRLLLKWHPDKNIGNEKFATTVTQHIQAEIERLELGLSRAKNYNEFATQHRPDPRNPFSGDSSFQQNFYDAYKFFFEQMNRRAKEHKEQRERYRENFTREYSPGNRSFNFGVPPTFASANPQPAQAKRFLRQAHEDLKAADNDFKATENPAYEWVCFKAHQAAEKSLKAAQFFVDASTSFSHDLMALAATLEDLDLKDFAMKLQNIVGNSNKLYNPEPIDFVVIPHDEYNETMAENSVELARLILDRVNEIIEIRDLTKSSYSNTLNYLQKIFPNINQKLNLMPSNLNSRANDYQMDQSLYIATWEALNTSNILLYYSKKGHIRLTRNSYPKKCNKKTMNIRSFKIEKRWLT